MKKEWAFNLFTPKRPRERADVRQIGADVTCGWRATLILGRESGEIGIWRVNRVLETRAGFESRWSLSGRGSIPPLSAIELEDEPAESWRCFESRWGRKVWGSRPPSSAMESEPARRWAGLLNRVGPKGLEFESSAFRKPPPILR